MLLITEVERQFLTDTRSLGIDAQGHEILVGLSFEESTAYIAHQNFERYGQHSNSQESDDYLNLYAKHEHTRVAVIVAELEARNDTSLRH